MRTAPASATRLRNSATGGGKPATRRSSSYIGIGLRSNVSITAPAGVCSTAARSSPRLKDARLKLPAMPRMRSGSAISSHVGGRVLAEQLLEALHAAKVFGSEAVVEAAQVGLGLLGRPARLGLLPRHGGKIGEAGGERTLEELAEVGLHAGVERAAHRPHRVDERQAGPLEPVGAEVERVREALGPLLPHTHRAVADHEQPVGLRRLEAADVAHAVEAAAHVE